MRNPHTITRRCPVIEKPYSVTVEAEDWIRWRNLENSLFPMSYYFPYLTEAEREFLISGISPMGNEHLFRGSQSADLESED